MRFRNKSLYQFLVGMEDRSLTKGQKRNFRRPAVKQVSEPRVKKHFFFEKKKQKTFDFWKRQLAKDPTQVTKVFLVLFFKKELPAYLFDHRAASRHDAQHAAHETNRFQLARPPNNCRTPRLHQEDGLPGSDRGAPRLRRVGAQPAQERRGVGEPGGHLACFQPRLYHVALFRQPARHHLRFA